MSIRVGSVTYAHISPGSDRDSFEALADARALKSSGHAFSSAVLHRFDGMLLLEGDARRHTTSGHHLRSANCGYAGTGPRIAAEILEMFGFGSKEKLLETISKKDGLVLTRD